MDEGWTRWVLERYEFPYTTLHNSDIKAGKLREKFDVIVLPEQQPRDILTGYDFKTVREEYRGGIGDKGPRSASPVCSRKWHVDWNGREL